MIIPPADPNDPKSVNRRSLIIMGLLVVAAGLAAYLQLGRDTDRVLMKRAEEVCGDGNVAEISETSFSCKAANESSQ